MMPGFMEVDMLSKHALPGFKRLWPLMIGGALYASPVMAQPPRYNDWRMGPWMMEYVRGVPKMYKIWRFENGVFSSES